jgi:transcriptional regulator with XRE-family HTH domain/tetratricopeptide (TPR) repeat protein
VTEQPEPGFAGLLRQLRAEARLTQEELAQAAGLSPRSVSDLERGLHRTARKDTAVLLADALNLAEPVRDLFVAAALGHVAAAEVLAAVHGRGRAASLAAATKTLPRDTASFTGREHELAQLVAALASAAASSGPASIFVIDGMAGIGKTTLAVHAAHLLAASFSDGQFFLPLHGHMPGQRPVEPDEALASLLLTAGVPAAQIPSGVEARAARWRDYAAGKKILLLLDDAAGHEQIRLLLPGTAVSVVLVTSRRRLAALSDATVISLGTLSPGEAATLLARLAARPGIRATDEAVGEIARLCGYLPLAIAMLAGQLRHHPSWTAAGMADGLAAALDRLAVMRAEDLSVAAAFDLSYADLTPARQRLFRRLGLVPGPSVDAFAAAALDGTGPEAARHDLGELYDQHLLTEPAPGRYVLHDLLRAHARALAAADDPAGSEAATRRLLDYYLHTARAADQHISSGTAPGSLRPQIPPAHAPDLATLEQAAAWLETERLNLHAAAAHAAARGWARHAVQIPAAMREFLFAHGYLDQLGALNRIVGGILRSQTTAGFPTAAASPDRVLALSQAHGLHLLALLRSLTSDHPAAAGSYQQMLALARLGNRLGQAHALNHLGLVLQRNEDYPAAASSFQRALDLFGDLGHQPGQAAALNNLGQLTARTAGPGQASRYYTQALAIARATDAPIEEARALEGLGQAHLHNGDPAEAASHLRRALAIYQRTGPPADAQRVQESLRRLGPEPDSP